MAVLLEAIVVQMTVEGLSAGLMDVDDLVPVEVCLGSRLVVEEVEGAGN